MNKLLTIGVIVIVAIGVIVLASLNLQRDESKNSEESIKIMVTTYPLYEFTTSIVRDKGRVDILTPSGVEVHDWEPSARDLQRLEGFDMLIYNSKGLEPYISKIEREVSIRLVDASNNIIIENDPHVWLDPLLAKEQVKNILNSIVSIDPENEQYYRENALAYIERLDTLHNEFSKGLEDCERREFIVLHSAYRYLAERYGLNEIPLLKLPEEDIEPSEIQKIIEIVRANNIDVIYAEENIDDRLMKAISEEVNAKILTLTPIEIISEEDMMRGITYIDKMRSNLENLRIGLGCV